jgi:osmotically-inducible protein OsmY
MFDRLTREREKPLLDDDELQELITDRIDDDPVFHLNNGRRARINVAVDDGEATLSGMVRTASDRRKADIMARALGASTVHNQLNTEEENEARKRPRRAA